MTRASHQSLLLSDNIDFNQGLEECFGGVFCADSYYEKYCYQAANLLSVVAGDLVTVIGGADDTRE